jgi:putative transcriptional regulator
MLDELNIQQVDLSIMTGIRPATINQYYHNSVKFVNLDYISKICEALNCEVEDLLRYIPDKKNKK